MVKQAQEWLGHGDRADHPATLRAPHHGRAGEGGGRARRCDAAASERTNEKVLEDGQSLEDNVVALASRRR